MNSPLSDTPQEVENIQIALLRQSALSERLARVRSLSATVRDLSYQAIRRAHPELTHRELDLLFVEYHYNSELAQQLRSFFEQEAL